MNLLLENKRFEMVKKMVDQFEDRYREEKGIVLCQILSAQELTAPQKQEVQKAAKAKAAKGQTLEFKFEVQPPLLGGLVVKLGDAILDYSVQARLDRMQASLLQPVE